MLNKRKCLLIALLSLPAVALLAWRGIVQLDLRRTPALRWDLPARGSIRYGDHSLVGARPGDPPPERVSEIPPGTFPADRAALIAWYVIYKHMGAQAFQSYLYGEGPTLVRATFPDGERRLAWRRTSLLSEDEIGMNGVAAAVYVDATTGAPLALVRDIYVLEPSWSPLFLSSNKYHWAVWLRTSGQFLFLALYVAVVLFVVGVVSGIRWLRARRKAATEG